MPGTARDIGATYEPGKNQLINNIYSLHNLKNNRIMNTSLEIIRSARTDYLCYRMEDDTFVTVHNPMLSFTEKEDEFEIIPTDKSYREKLYIYQGQAVRLVPQIYHNGWLALCLELADTEEPYTTLTVNLEEMDAIGLPDRASSTSTTIPMRWNFWS